MKKINELMVEEFIQESNVEVSEKTLGNNVHMFLPESKDNVIN